MRNLHVVIPSELWQRLQARAHHDVRPYAAIVQEALEAWLAAEGPSKPMQTQAARARESVRRSLIGWDEGDDEAQTP